MGLTPVTQQEADAKAAALERGLRQDGLWDKIDFLMRCDGGGGNTYILEKQGDHVVARFVGFDP